jgi:FtsP/CotA-like multicopper oxidase with cupredoxin domain
MPLIPQRTAAGKDRLAGANIKPRRAGALAATRRDLLCAGGAALAGLLLPGPARCEPQPPPTGDGVRILAARSDRVRLCSIGAETDIWSFAGGVPGPVLRVPRASATRIRLQNGLPAPIGLHWHGIRNAPEGPGGLTRDPIEPGASFDYRLQPPDAGTFWYRAHGLASSQRRHGLHGLLIVEEDTPPAIDHEAALLLDAWLLNADGSLATEAGAGGAGGSGERCFTANGAPSVDIPVRTNGRLRLRLLNASPDALTVRLERHTATIMAIDGQPAEPFGARSGRFRIAPGNRADLFVDALLEPGAMAPLALETERGDVPVARLVYESAPPLRAAPRPYPMPLPSNPLPARMDFVGALKLSRAVETLTAAAGAKPLFTVKRGRAVMLGLHNTSAFVYVVHVHGHAFRLLDNLDDGWKPFWLDTLPIDSGQTARIAFVADNPGKWPLEAQALGQAESGGAWFEVT